jgi:4-alpha-glucanotransferase
VSADAWGIEDGYLDTRGVWRATPPEVRAALRRAMGAEGERPPPEPVLVVRRGEPRPPTGGPATLTLEDGTTLRVDGALPADLPLGYHELRPVDGRPPAWLVVAPAHCHRPPVRRTWGWAVQLYALRSRGSWGIGDLADLRHFAEWSARALGAGAVLLNPLHAPLPLAPPEASPYFPSSRRYRNPLYLCVEEVPGAAEARLDLEALAAQGRALAADRRIDRGAVFRLKMAALERLWARGAAGAPALARYRAREGRALEEFAIFCALAEWHGGGWRRWPAEHRHPEAPAVGRFAADQAERVAFHAWVQWLLDEQLARAGGALRLITDLAVGFDGEGADAWAWQDVLARGVTVGAPPDDFAVEGQDWGFPPFTPHRLRAVRYRPLIETLRASLRHAGGLRVDHVMGLFRLFWVPAGGPASAGAYVSYVADEVLAILALESERAGAVVIGEDLGTVAPGVRERLAAEHVLSTRVLWFEPGLPSTYPPLSLATITTHDLPTVAGLWTGRDLAEQLAVGLRANVEGTAALRARLRELARVPDGAAPEDVVLAAHRALAEAPSVLVTATLEDALAVVERPNIPGTTGDQRPNWSLALPRLVEEIEEDPRVRAVAAILGTRGAAVGPERA